MIVGGVIQQPDEVLDYDFLYSDWLSGDSIASTVSAVIPTGELAATAVQASDTEIKIWVSGGLPGSSYIVEVTSTTVAGRIKQDELEVYIEEF